MIIKTTIYSFALTFAKGRNWYRVSAAVWQVKSAHFEQAPVFDALVRRLP